jgi:hypothetical protein
MPRQCAFQRRSSPRLSLNCVTSGTGDQRTAFGDGTRVFLIAILFRLASALIAFFANVTFPPYVDQGFSVFRTDHAFWDTFARYDAGWYHGIATQGYVYAPGGRNNLAFFPAYPLLMRAGGALLGGRQQDYYFAGIVISWLAFAGAMTMLYRLALLDLSRTAALRAVIYAATFPFAFFFGLVYSESLFLLGLVTAAYGLRTRRWLLGAAAGAVMTATRVTGVMAVAGLAFLAWQAAGADSRTRIKAVAASAATTLGFAGYCAYNYAISGTPFAWYDAITFWNYRPGGNPFASVARLLQALATRPYQFLATENMAPYDTLNAVFSLFALAFVPLIWRRFNAGYALIVLAGVMLPLSSGSFEGLGRYSSVQFPIALAMASLAGELRHHVLLATSAAGYGLLLAMFATVHPLF